ncbi:TolC family outer membrane protein [Arhodomonas sp. AD133]|uniref:TolC family outer membrane protein n=1 Tax=Arhodomonas sp. AD133 TaxID=3415009 RepID=UPI003EBBD1F9
MTVVLGTLALLCSGTSMAKAANTPDLLTVYQLALEHAPELQAARERLRAERQVLARSRSRLLPSLTVSAEYARLEQRSEGVTGVVPASDEHFPREIYQATLSQPLFNLESWYAYRAGKAEARSAEARFRQTLQRFRLRVVEAYFEALRAQSQRLTREAELKAARRQRERIERELDAGTASLLEVQEIKAETKRVEVSLIRSEERVDQRLRKLESMAGKPLPRIQALLPSALPSLDDSFPLSQWLNRAQATNPRLRKVRRARQAAREEASAAQSARYPRLSLDLSYQHDAASAADAGIRGGDQLATNTATIGVQLEMPLYSGGRLVADRREASHRYGQAKGRHRQVRQDVFNGIKTQFHAVRIQQRAITAAEEAVSAQELAVTTAEKGYRAGVRDLVDVVRARREHFAAIETLNDARFDLILALARLHRLGGSLDEDRMKAFNRWVGKR